jgi:hypothetical protein
MARQKNADEQAASGGMALKTERIASGKERSGFADPTDPQSRNEEKVGRGDVIQFGIDRPLTKKTGKKDEQRVTRRRRKKAGKVTIKIDEPEHREAVQTAPVMNQGGWGKPPVDLRTRAARRPLKLLREVPASWQINSSRASEVRKIDPKSIDAAELLARLERLKRAA